MVDFYLTRRANIDLIRIEEFSLRKWGEDQTEHYINDLYQIFREIARKPEMGRLRYDRSFPFFMAPARMHFAIYKPIDSGIIIATILHSHRNIESIVRNMALTLLEKSGMK